MEKTPLFHALRRLSHFSGDLAYFGIHRIEHARQVSRDPLGEQPAEPFIEFVEYAAHKRSRPALNRKSPASRGTRVMPIRATPASGHELFYPQIGVENGSMAGGGVSRNIYGVFKNRPGGGRSGP